MSNQVRWGIAGPGGIASTFAQDFVHVEDARLTAVGSRDLGRAQAFAGDFGAEHAFGSYRELCACDEVDVVYVATPHPQHKAVALEAIRNGKAVLVEKPLTATLQGTRELVAAAREAKVFAMEAMWTRFQPAIRKLHEIVDAGQLGRIRMVEASFLMHRDVDMSHRLFAKELGGGSLLDLGVYPIAFAHDFLGVPHDVATVGTLLPNGVDAQVAMALSYGDGALAMLGSSLQADGQATARIIGEAGFVELAAPFFHTSTLSVHRNGVRPQELELPATGNGYTHQIAEVTRCIGEGRLESDLMPLQATLEVAGMMHDALGQLGVSYDEDETIS